MSQVASTLAAFHDDSVPQYPFDVRRAEALLDEAGFKCGPDGIRFSLTHDFLPYGGDVSGPGST
ncbi:hypothetical protein [Methylobacterium aquaticum]|uniref:hypothetical protein n=1 Tax=Methylobacterium aquaticum TaxID=270351 RepID=UPI0032B23309